MTDITGTITLDGQAYAIRKFTIAQLRQLFGSNLPKGEFGFEVLKMALSRATPAVPDIDALEVDASELTTAVEQVIQFTGLAPKKAAAE